MKTNEDAMMREKTRCGILGYRELPEWMRYVAGVVAVIFGMEQVAYGGEFKVEQRGIIEPVGCPLSAEGWDVEHRGDIEEGLGEVRGVGGVESGAGVEGVEGGVVGMKDGEPESVVGVRELM